MDGAYTRPLGTGKLSGWVTRAAPSVRPPSGLMSGYPDDGC